MFDITRQHFNSCNHRTRQNLTADNFQLGHQTDFVCITALQHKIIFHSSQPLFFDQTVNHNFNYAFWTMHFGVDNLVKMNSENKFISASVAGYENNAQHLGK